MTFKTETQIRFRHTDLAGISFFANVFPLAHDAFEEFVQKGLKLDKSYWFENKEWAVPIKHTEAEYFAPLMPFYRCDQEVTINNIGTSSFKITTIFKQHDTKCAQVITTHLFMDLKTKQKIDIPEKIKNLLSSFQTSVE